MLNHVVLVGRLVNAPELYKTDTGKTISSMVLAIPRPYKSISGEYESDFIDCTLWQGVAENSIEYVKPGDLLGVKGHLSSYEVEQEDGTMHRKNRFVVERISFLTTKEQKKSKKEEVNEEEKK